VVGARSMHPVQTGLRTITYVRYSDTVPTRGGGWQRLIDGSYGSGAHIRVSTLIELNALSLHAAVSTSSRPQCGLPGLVVGLSVSPKLSLSTENQPDREMIIGVCPASGCFV
jgi:hypothetical protein